MNTSRRIGVIIHHGHDNYGNHLVNYATRRILQDRGYQADLLVPIERTTAATPLDTLGQAHLTGVGFSDVRQDAADLFWSGFYKVAPGQPEQADMTATWRLRRARFKSFSRQYLKPIRFYVDERADLLQRYSRIAIGSDQIWNFDFGADDVHFADFAPAERKFTMSPSVGHTTLRTEWVDRYEKLLGSFREVGARELEWAAELEHRPGAPRFTQLIDPTLMLTAPQWRAVATDQSAVRGKILVYKLGQLSAHERDFVAGLAKTAQCEVLHLSSEEAGLAWATNAADFVGMLDAARCVVTDSFHGAAFSVSLGKPLVMIPRQGAAAGMNTRIRTLVDLLSIKDRLIENTSPAEALHCDYADAHLALRELRRDYHDYLDRQGVVHLP